jgi:hypothetical protein
MMLQSNLHDPCGCVTYLHHKNVLLTDECETSQAAQSGACHLQNHRHPISNPRSTMVEKERPR